MTLSNKIRVICAATTVGFTQMLACELRCDDPKPLESGEYLVIERVFGPIEQEWLIGAQLMVDREAGIATLRYTYEGTTYEAQYALGD